MDYPPVNEFVPDENSRPGIYLGVMKQDGRWYPIITLVAPEKFRSEEIPGVFTGTIKGHPGSTDQMEIEAYVRGELTEMVKKMVGPNLEGIADLQPIGRA